MTISPNPRIFDLSAARPVSALPGIAEPALHRVFWHGTRMEHLDSILHSGLVPEKTLVGHTCLSTDPAMALLFARLQQCFNPRGSGVEPVLIRIDGTSLDPDVVCAETGVINCGSYGEGMEGRSRGELGPLRYDWRRLLNASSALGYTETIPVHRGMVEERTRSLPALNTEGALREMGDGFPSQQETVHLLKDIERELAPLMAA